MKQHEIMKLIKAFENILKSEPTKQQKKEKAWILGEIHYRFNTCEKNVGCRTFKSYKKALEFAEELKNEGYIAHAVETLIQDCVEWCR